MTKKKRDRRKPKKKSNRGNPKTTGEGGQAKQEEEKEASTQAQVVTNDDRRNPKKKSNTTGEGGQEKQEEENETSTEVVSNGEEQETSTEVVFNDEEKDADDDNQKKFDPFQDEKYSEEFHLALNFAIECARYGRQIITVRWIVKNMPVTAKALQDRVCEVKDFWGSFDDKFTDIVMDMEESASRDDQVSKDVLRITEKALPDRFGKAAGLDEWDHLEHYDTFARGFEERMLFLETVFKDSADPNRGIDWMGYFKTATDATCEAMAATLDKVFFRGKRGVFLKKCPVYKKPIHFFSSFLPQVPGRRDMESVRERHNLQFNADKVILRCENLMEAVYSGDYHAHKNCWECDEVVATAKMCSGCQVAIFCGKDCQKAGWKAGHNTDCKLANIDFQKIRDDVDCVTAFQDAEIERKIVPAYCYQYWALDRCARFTYKGSVEENPWVGTEHEAFLSAYSMTAYFDNLRRVQNNELWFFSEGESIQSYKSRVCRMEDYRITESKLFSGIHEMLFFDYAGCLEQSETTTSFDAFADSNYLLEKDMLDLRMPAVRFLELYDEERYFGRIDDRDNMREQLKKETLKKHMWFLFVKYACA